MKIHFSIDTMCTENQLYSSIDTKQGENLNSTCMICFFSISNYVCNIHKSKRNTSIFHLRFLEFSFCISTVLYNKNNYGGFFVFANESTGPNELPVDYWSVKGSIERRNKLYICSVQCTVHTVKCTQCA